MENAIYIFQVSPLDAESLLPQVSKALEKRTELISRERYPGLWKRIDKSNAAAGGAERRAARSRAISAVLLALGVFLFLLGLMGPRELPLPLIAGAVGIAAGASGLWRNRKNKGKPFERAAKRLLADKAAIQPGQYQVLFSPKGMAITGQGQDGGDSVPYGKFECVIEAADVFLLTFDGRAAILLKRDISKGSLRDFCKFISKKVAKYHPHNEKAKP